MANGDAVLPPKEPEVDSTGIELLDDDILPESEAGGMETVVEGVHLDD